MMKNSDDILVFLQNLRHTPLLGGAAAFLNPMCALLNCTVCACSYHGPKFMDPLQRALDRGSKALDFLNTPLVLDYVHIKFSCSLPHWASSNPFQPTINEGFYMYSGFDQYALRDLRPAASENEQDTEDNQDTQGNQVTRFMFCAFLLRCVELCCNTFVARIDPCRTAARRCGNGVRSVPCVVFMSRVVTNLPAKAHGRN